MKFGTSKYSKVIEHRGKYEPTEGISTSTGRITDVETDKGYKYIGVLQTNEKWKNKINYEAKQIYMKRIKQVMKSNVNGRNKIKAIKSYASITKHKCLE